MSSFSSFMSSNSGVVTVANLCSILGGLFILWSIGKWCARFAKEVLAHNLAQAIAEIEATAEFKARRCAEDAISNQLELAHRWWQVAIGLLVNLVILTAMILRDPKEPSHLVALFPASYATTVLQFQIELRFWAGLVVLVYLCWALLGLRFHIITTRYYRLQILREKEEGNPSNGGTP